MQTPLNRRDFLQATVATTALAAAATARATHAPARADLPKTPTDKVKLGKEKLFNQVGAYLESNPYGLAVVVANTGATGEKEKNLKLSQARAMVVRQYLVQKFKVDDSRIKTLGAGEDGQAADKGGRVAIVVYPAAGGHSTVQAKNR